MRLKTSPNYIFIVKKSIISFYFEFYTFSDKTWLITALNYRLEAETSRGKIYDVSITFLFDAILLPVKARTGTNATFNSGVLSLLNVERLTIAVTIFPKTLQIWK